EDSRRYGAEQKIEQDVAATDILAPERRGVGTARKEHRVSERHLSGLQEQDDSEHDDALGEDQREQRGPARHKQRRNGGCQEEQDGSQGNRLKAAGHHQIFLNWVAPNRPNGRTRSTSTMIR